MEPKNKVCWSCGYYVAYYTKGDIHFFKRNVGFCAKNQKIVEKHEQCECWTRYKYRPDHKKSAIRALNEILTDLAAIKQILCGDGEEENEENTQK